mmetsp:Transcript_21778/g.39712  ORF Transcript_21778/g.39712 Transcript_21778/m.39712 type:complete len:250 (-) Transcript_21778:637-1386(-)
MGLRQSSPKQQLKLRCKVLLVGDHGVGKTSLLRAYQEQIAGTRPEDLEEGISCRTSHINVEFKGYKVDLMCMDSLNQEDLELKRRLLSIQNCDVGMLIMDISDDTYFDRIPMYVKLLAEHNYSNTLLLVGNKLDLGSEAKARVVELLEEGLDLEIELYLVSASTGAGIPQLFERAVELGLQSSMRWVITRGLLFVYNQALAEQPDNTPSTGMSLSNLCEAIPGMIMKKSKKFPLQRLSLRHIQLMADLL